MTPSRPAPRRIPSFGSRGLHRVVTSLFDLVPAEHTWSVQLLCDPAYFRSVLIAITGDPARSRDLRNAAERLLHGTGEPASGYVILKNVLEREAGYAADGHPAYGHSADGHPADGMLTTGTATVDAAARNASPLPVILYLDNIRSPFNAGNIIRTAAAFGIAGVVLNEGCPDLNHPRLRRAAMGSLDLVPCVRGSLDEARRCAVSGVETWPCAKDVPVYAVETGGAALDEQAITVPAVFILGHEELGVSPSMMEASRQSGGVLSIRHEGPKRSLNVGVAAGILLYHVCSGA